MRVGGSARGVSVGKIRFYIKRGRFIARRFVGLKALFVFTLRARRGDCDGCVKGVLKVIFGGFYLFSRIRIDDEFQFLFLIEPQIIIKKNYYLAHYCLTI